MKKFENFCRCFGVLERADFALVSQDEVYRMGIVGQFNLTFELAWKALKETLGLHAVEGADRGSPREILKLAYSMGWLSSADVWQLMLHKRNTSVHIYDENEVDELVVLIRDSFIPAFTVFRDMLKEKIDAVEDDWA